MTAEQEKGMREVKDEGCDVTGMDVKGSSSRGSLKDRKYVQLGYVK